MVAVTRPAQASNAVGLEVTVTEHWPEIIGSTANVGTGAVVSATTQVLLIVTNGNTPSDADTVTTLVPRGRLAEKNTVLEEGAPTPATRARAR